MSVVRGNILGQALSEVEVMPEELTARCHRTNPANRKQVLYVPCSFKGDWNDALLAHAVADTTGYFEWLDMSNRLNKQPIELFRATIDPVFEANYRKEMDIRRTTNAEAQKAAHYVANKKPFFTPLRIGIGIVIGYLLLRKK